MNDFICIVIKLKLSNLGYCHLELNSYFIPLPLSKTPGFLSWGSLESKMLQRLFLFIHIPCQQEGLSFGTDLFIHSENICLWKCIHSVCLGITSEFGNTNSSLSSKCLISIYLLYREWFSLICLTILLQDRLYLSTIE